MTIAQLDRDSAGAGEFGADGDSNVDVYTGCVKSLFWEFWQTLVYNVQSFLMVHPLPSFVGASFITIATFIIFIYDNFDDIADKEEKF